MVRLSDNMSSSFYITDELTNIIQLHDDNPPYGELLVEEDSISKDLAYEFNCRQLDEKLACTNIKVHEFNHKYIAWGRAIG